MQSQIARAYAGLRLLVLVTAIGGNVGKSAEFELYQVGGWPGFIRGGCAEVQIRGEFAYVALDTGGRSRGNLVIFNVTDPNAPERLGSVEIPDGPSFLRLVGDQAYVFSGLTLSICDVSDPRKPLFVRKLDLGWAARDFTYLGRYGYMAGGGTHEVGVWDLQNPLVPVPVGGIDLCDFYLAQGVAVKEGNLFVTFAGSSEFTSGRGALAVASIADPVHPSWISSCPTNLPVFQLILSGQRAYTVRGASFGIWDLSNAGRPVLLSEHAVPDVISDIVVSNNLCYVASPSGLRILDVLNPSRILERSSLLQHGYRAKLAFSGEHVYFAHNSLDADDGLQIIDVHAPSSPRLVGHYRTGGTSYDVALTGHYAYLADGERGLQIVDVIQPAFPVAIRQLNEFGSVTGIALADGYAYVAARTNLIILDVRAPAAPVEVGRIATRTSAWRVAVSGTRVGVVGPLVFGASTGFELIDVSDHSQPRSLWPQLVVDDGYAVALDGDRAYVGVLRGLETIGGIASGAPQMLSSYRNPIGNVGQLAAAGPYVYLANGNAGMEVIDTRNPSDPRRVSGVALPNARAVGLTRSYALVADEGLGVYAVDVSNPTNVIVRASSSRLFRPISVTAVGNFVYVADGGAGLSILGLNPPGAPTPVTLTITKLPTEVRLYGQGQPGRTHILQDSLFTGEWHNLATNRATNGSFRQSILLSNAPAGRLFRALSY